MTGTPPVHLVRTRIDRLALSLFAARTGTLDDDLGYAVHLALRRRFGAAGPQPFRLMDPDDANPGVQRLLAYAVDPAALAMPPALPDPDGDWPDVAAVAGVFSEPFEARSMPRDWPVGTVLQFDLRLRPVRRHRRHGPLVQAMRQQRGKPPVGVERDVFQLAVEGLERGIHDETREGVYARWLAERLAPAAHLEDARLAAFARTRLLRGADGGGDRGRRGRGTEGPDASMSGRLRIVDGPAFGELLARGIGRHRAFGFGMLLLRPAGA